MKESEILHIDTSGNNNITVQLADLGLMSEVRSLASRLLESEPAIHVLINNAAILTANRKLTAEGLEQTESSTG